MFLLLYKMKDLSENVQCHFVDVKCLAAVRVIYLNLTEDVLQLAHVQQQAWGIRDFLWDGPFVSCKNVSS